MKMYIAGLSDIVQQRKDQAAEQQTDADQALREQLIVNHVRSPRIINASLRLQPQRHRQVILHEQQMREQKHYREQQGQIELMQSGLSGIYLNGLAAVDYSAHMLDSGMGIDNSSLPGIFPTAGDFFNKGVNAYVDQLIYATRYNSINPIQPPEFTNMNWWLAQMPIISQAPSPVNATQRMWQQITTRIGNYMAVPFNPAIGKAQAGYPNYSSQVQNGVTSAYPTYVAQIAAAKAADKASLVKQILIGTAEVAALAVGISAGAAAATGGAASGAGASAAVPGSGAVTSVITAPATVTTTTLTSGGLTAGELSAGTSAAGVIQKAVAASPSVTSSTVLLTPSAAASTVASNVQNASPSLMSSLLSQGEAAGYAGAVTGAGNLTNKIVSNALTPASSAAVNTSLAPTNPTTTPAASGGILPILLAVGAALAIFK